MELELPNKIFFLDKYTIDIFSVCYCNNIIIGYNYSSVHTM